MITEDKNVYLHHIEQDSWNELHAYHIENQAMWRNLAILAIIALVTTAIYAMYVVNQDKHKIIVFEKDGLGNISALGIATNTLKIDNRIIAHQLVNFVLGLEEVPQDINIKRRNITLVHTMIDPKLKRQMDTMIINQYNRAKDGTVNVVINSVRPLEGGRSWQLVWVEKIYDSSGTNIVKTNHFSAIITFKQVNLAKIEDQLINPAGIYITYFNLVEDIVDNGT